MEWGQKSRKQLKAVKISELKVSLASVNYSKKEHSMMQYWNNEVAHEFQSMPFQYCNYERVLCYQELDTRSNNQLHMLVRANTVIEC